jgi:fructoselysine-6-P-deglycase FrlB-like protein
MTLLGKADWPIGFEAALKLKEMAHRYAFGVAVGDFRHGPLARVKPELAAC